jgi:hypothetical protein
MSIPWDTLTPLLVAGGIVLLWFFLLRFKGGT